MRALLLVGGLLGCGGAPSKEGDETALPADTDTDTDTDTDAESDAEPPCVATGFEGVTSSWALPGGYPDGTFAETVDTSSVAPNWALLDLEGDGRLDLVVTSDPTADTTIGVSRWMVYANTGAGFSGTGTPWALPGGYPAGTFATPNDTSTASPNWAILDLDGEGGPELVLTADSAVDPAIGSSRWEVYESTGSGFAGLTTDWPLPSGYPDGTFATAYDRSTASPNWALLDLDAGGRTDLVFTYDSAADAALGVTHWLVYDNGGAGFAGTGTTWALPGGYPDGTFHVAYDTSTTAPNWALLDDAGSGAPDLVFTYDPDADAAIGASTWLAYPNAGNGFSGATTTLQLPAGYPDGTFHVAYDTSAATPNWALLDLDRDGRSDVVFTLDSAADATLGSTHWISYPGAADGFVSVGTTWALPGGYADATFATTYDSSSASPNWALFDLYGEAPLDLVFTLDTAAGDPTLGATEWAVYRGVCGAGAG